MPQTPEEMLQVMRQVAEAAAAATWERFVAEWKTWSLDTLAAAGAPPWEAFVRVHADGSWANDLPPDWPIRPGDVLREGEWIGDLTAWIRYTYGSESLQQYAYEIGLAIEHLHLAHTAQDMDAALRAFHRLHTWATIVRIRVEWQPDADYGRRRRDDSRRGGAMPKHDPEDTQRRDAKRQSLADGTWERNPHLSTFAVARIVGKMLGESPHTTRKKIVRPPTPPSRPNKT